MKKLLLLFTLILAALPQSLHAFTVSYEGYTFEYSILDASAKTCELTNVPLDFIGGCSLPEQIKVNGINYTLRSIGVNAFNGCSGLTGITIPNSVTSIGARAFRGCSGLKKAEFTSIESLCKIIFANTDANPLYSAHNLYINGQEITKLVIPNSVTSIGSSNFAGCSGLTEVTIPNSVTSIGEYAFYGCSGLTEVTIPNSVTSIGSSNFADCSGLTEVTIPNSVTSIGSDAFIGCSGLTEVTIPNSVTYIGGSAFYGCSGLTEIAIPNSVTFIDVSAFSKCSALKKVEFASIESLCKIIFGNTGANPLCSAHNLYINGQEITKLVIPNSVTSIRSYNFAGCSGLTEVTIPNSVTSIGWQAFYGCSGLTEVTIPNSVTYIGSQAFSKCTNLQTVLIGSSVEYLQDDAFEDCPNIDFVVKPSSLEYSWDKKIRIVSYPSYMGVEDFSFEDHCLYSKNRDILYFASYSLSGDCVISETVTRIYDKAFGNCDKVTSVIFPRTVTTFGESIFTGCTSLIKIAQPFMLHENENLSNLICISDKYFNTTIGYDYYDSRTEDGFVLSRDRRHIFFAPTLLPNDYQLPETATIIGKFSFAGSENLTSIEIGNQVTMIETGAFALSGGLVNVKIGDLVTSIGEVAFSKCVALKILSLGSSVDKIGSKAFYNCSNINRVECRSTTPPSAPNDIFPLSVYDNATLVVPQGSLKDYTEALPWRLFNIEEGTFSGIENLTDSEMTANGIDYTHQYDVYSPAGVRINAAIEDLAPGIYIIRQDSIVKKISVN